MTWTKSSLLNPLISSTSSSSSSSSFHNTTTHQEMKRHKVVVRRGESSQSSANSSSFAARTIRYGECQKNHAASVGGYAVDGCREFMPSGEEGSGAAALTCAACGCHRNFHRREVQANEVLNDVSSSNAA